MFEIIIDLHVSEGISPKERCYFYLNKKVSKGISFSNKMTTMVRFGIYNFTTKISAIAQLRACITSK